MDSGTGASANVIIRTYEDRCKLVELMRSHETSGSCNNELLQVFYSFSGEELVLFMEVVVAMVRRDSQAEEIIDEEHYTSLISIIKQVNSLLSSRHSSMPEVAKDLQIIDEALNRLNSILDTTTFHVYYVSLICWCEPLCELVIILHEDILLRRLELANIEKALEKFRIEFLKYCESECSSGVYVKNKNIFGTLHDAYLTLKLAMKHIDKKTIDFVKDILKAHWLQPIYVTGLVCNLLGIFKTPIKADRIQEVTQLLEVCLPAACDHLLLFCSKGDGYSQSEIDELVRITCRTSALWLENISAHDSKEIKGIFSDFLGRWSVAKKSCDKIPHPEGLIEEWVLIQCKQIQDPEHSDMKALTIYSLMSTFQKVSKEVLGFLMKQELVVYRKLKLKNENFCNAMLRIVIKLYEDLNPTNDHLKRSRNLMESAKQFRESGVVFLDDCKNSICEAIKIMAVKARMTLIEQCSTIGENFCVTDIQPLCEAFTLVLNNLQRNSKGDSGPVCYILAGAYWIRALCSQELNSNSQEIIQDIEKAIELWSNQEGSLSAIQCEKLLSLLYCILDLLSIKGYLLHHSKLYEKMINCFNKKNVALEDWLTTFWRSRSLSHGLCISPINEAFISVLSKHTESSNSMPFWTSCMQKFELQASGFEQNMTIPSTLSSHESHSHNYTTQKVKETAANLLAKDPQSKTSLFAVAYMYYDLAETLSAKGSMALFYAKEAYRSRTSLLQKAFAWSYEVVRAIIGDNGEVTEGMRCLKTLSLRTPFATAAWLNDKKLGYFEKCFTPWKLLECYLESSLQVLDSCEGISIEL